MEHTIKVYKNSPEHGDYLKARFPDGSRSNSTFEYAGHRWGYRYTSFDDKGDYDLLYRFDDEPDVQSLTVNDATLRDYFAAKAMQGDLASQDENTGYYENSTPDEYLAARAEFYYRMADAMLRAREK
ncbi:hypothetical protein [Morganella morganii]|uniref:hypothetical protein n=1 Tax=Morganella morganii TaxID=582 RepID=UPI002023ABB8|nr:hypothetical protein [Morganella morganii]MBT0460596.1 hypothetical protein [Morganella morganii subsp. morganii]